MGVIPCPHCERLNLEDELRARGFICELCGKVISQGNAAQQEHPPETTQKGLDEAIAALRSARDDAAFQAGPPPPRTHEAQAVPRIAVEPQRASAGAGSTPLAITGLLLTTIIGVNHVTGSGLPGLMIVAATAIWAAIDSSRLELHKYKGGTNGAFLVFLGIVFLWIVFFPIYLFKRARLLNGELHLKKKYRTELWPTHQGALDLAPPTARPASETDQGIRVAGPLSPRDDVKP